MARPIPQIASFLLALIVARAGFAGAGTLPAPPAAPTAPAPAEPVFVFTEAPGLSDSGEIVDWPALIAERLAALQTRPRAGDPSGPSARDRLSLRHQLASVVRRAGGARVGVHVRDLDSGEPLFDHHGDQLLNPASNQKLVTAIAAVELLGPGYRFETRVLRVGDDLVLVGEGDPSLQHPDLHALASEVVAAGAHRGVRRILVDDTAFSPERFGPGYSPHGDGASYTAPSGALSLNFNTAVVTIRPSEPGRPASVALTPPGAHVEVHGQVRTGRGRPVDVTSHDVGGRTIFEIAGSLPGGHASVTVRRRVADPGMFAGHAFAEVLRELTDAAEALPVDRAPAPQGAVEVARRQSAPLVEVLASSLKYSNNFTSEQVLRTLGWRMSGEPGSWDRGRDAVLAVWTGLGLDPADLHVENGAGLSRSGRVSPRALVALLARTRDEGSPAAALLPALASAGGEGTLRGRLTAQGPRVRGKTGTISGVSALSGVAASADGRDALGFSILINGGDRPARAHRRLQDRVVLALLGHLDARAREHRQRP
ncbi:MAG: D-alanyl-D-alanine carboxypeptidase/D-alanyl-D-alanine-endopeptidase [Myxococcales bacterium]|nr:D-alanyl-D-alanine carboxypeptidase/D-alanyl-D-alanine-endopeptidase [Myxococcales bacterium]